jgi:hypothetical protein
MVEEVRVERDTQWRPREGVLMTRRCAVRVQCAAKPY